MKKLMSILVLAIFLMSPLGMAQDEPLAAADDTLSGDDIGELEEVDAGTTPDSPLYGVDVALDRIRLALAFNKAKRAELSMKIAEERLSEVRAMIAVKKEVAAEKAEAEYGKALGKLTVSIDEADESDETEAIKFNARIRQKLELHKARKAEIAARIETGLEGNLTDVQKARVLKLLSRIDARASEVDVKIISKRDRLKIKLKTRLKTDAEIDAEFEKIEGNITGGFSPDRVFELIEKAQDRINKVRDEAEEKNTTFKAVDALMEKAQKHLDRAVEFADKEKYGAAFGQAKTSLVLSRNAERILDHPKKFRALKKEIREMKELKKEHIKEAKELRKEHRKDLRERIDKLKDKRKHRLGMLPDAVEGVSDSDDSGAVSTGQSLGSEETDTSEETDEQNESTEQDSETDSSTDDSSAGDSDDNTTTDTA